MGSIEMLAVNRSLWRHNTTCMGNIRKERSIYAYVPEYQITHTNIYHKGILSNKPERGGGGRLVLNYIWMSKSEGNV